MEWKERFGRNTRPAYEELIGFFYEDVRKLFLVFNQTMQDEYEVYNNYPRFEKAYGWVYGYCRKYRCELLSVRISGGYFEVLGVKIKDETDLKEALAKAREAYDDGYEERLESTIAAKKANQINRAKLRKERETAELEKIKETIDPSRFNRFSWPQKVSRAKLIRLYKLDAMGMMDENLLDDIGVAFYARCKDARDIREQLDNGRIICRNCGAVLRAQSYASLISCECGDYYTYREYRRGVNAAKLPGGRATPIFHDFADKWPRCKDAKEKMLLIDWLVHECHVSVMTGMEGRSVCANLIEGTIPQLRDMLETLAGH